MRIDRYLMLGILSGADQSTKLACSEAGNRELYEISRDPVLWTHVSIAWPQYHEASTFLGTCVHCERVVVAPCTAAVLRDFAKRRTTYPPSIRKVSVSLTDCIGSRDLEILATRFPGLEDLDVTVDTYTSNSVDIVPGRLRSLTYTDVHMATTLRFLPVTTTTQPTTTTRLSVRCGGISFASVVHVMVSGIYFETLETTESGYLDLAEIYSTAAAAAALQTTTPAAAAAAAAAAVPVRDLRVHLREDLLMTYLGAHEISVTTNTHRVVFDFRQIVDSPECSRIRVVSGDPDHPDRVPHGQPGDNNDGDDGDDEENREPRRRFPDDVVFVNADFEEFVEYFYVQRRKDLVIDRIDVLFRP